MTSGRNVFATKIFFYDLIFLGYGVFTERKFKKGSFLLEYAGETITREEGKARRASYPDEVGSYVLEYGNSW